MSARTKISQAVGKGRGRDPSSCVLSIADDPKRSSVIDRRRPQTSESLQVPAVRDLCRCDRLYETHTLYQSQLQCPVTFCNPKYGECA